MMQHLENYNLFQRGIPGSPEFSTELQITFQISDRILRKLGTSERYRPATRSDTLGAFM